jgi:hypothetical protein
MGLLERILQEEKKAKPAGLLNRALSARTFTSDEESPNEAFDSEKKKDSSVNSSRKIPPSSKPG